MHVHRCNFKDPDKFSTRQGFAYLSNRRLLLSYWGWSVLFVKAVLGLVQLPSGKLPPLLYGKLVPVAKVQSIFSAKETARLDAVEHDHEVLQWFDLVVLIQQLNEGFGSEVMPYH